MNKLKNPVFLCACFLGILALAATISRTVNSQNILPNLLLNFLIISIIVIFIPWVLTYLNIKRFLFLDSIISAQIIFLLIDPLQNILLTVVMGLITLSSRFIRYKGTPIFNPASIGIGVVALVSIFFNLDIFISWWGASFLPRFEFASISYALFIVIPFGLYLEYKMKKIPLVISAFISLTVAVFALSLIEKGIEIAYFLFEGTLIFAILVMLAEPKTSPIKKIPQIIYGMIFALAWFILMYLKIDNAIIFSILAANVFNLLVKLNTYKFKIGS